MEGYAPAELMAGRVEVGNRVKVKTKADGEYKGQVCETMRRGAEPLAAVLRWTFRDAVELRGVTFTNVAPGAYQKTPEKAGGGE